MRWRLVPVLLVGAALAAGFPEGLAGEKEGSGKQAGGDPAAAKLLVDARAGRALWVKFPGFMADIEVNLGGAISRGKARVAANGQVTLDGLDPEAKAWARPTLSSIVDHRLSVGTAPEQICTFGPGPADDPLGREVLVQGDKFQSSYRIRDRELRVVSREMKGQKFTITVLKNLINKEGKYLPASFVVSFWDSKTGDLTKTVANRQTWRRVGRFDLPVMALEITDQRENANAEGTSGQRQVAKSLTLSRHKLFSNAGVK
jgi:hypothetical protein